ALGKDNVTNARVFLGQALHTLQDFYAHSNWIEMGFRMPNTNLGHRISFPFAAANTPTCASCSLLPPDCCTILPLPGQIVSGTCPNCSANLTTNELTSGYYAGLTLQGVLPEDRTKPITTKCSHGGPF